MTAINSIRNVVVGSMLGGLSGFLAAYTVQVFLLGEGTLVNISYLSAVDTGTGRPAHQFSALYLTVKYVNLAAGVSVGAIVGSIAGCTVSFVQASRKWMTVRPDDRLHTSQFAP
jgi:hypothetical protein